MKGVYYKLLKSNQTVAAEQLSTTINRFESCFKPETFNNSSKKMQSEFCYTTMLEHMLQK